MTRGTIRQLVAGLLALTLIAAACSRDSQSAAPPDADDDVAAPTSAPAETSSTTTTTAAPTPVVLPDYAAEIAALPRAADDRSLPDITPDSPLGAYGYSRYVYQRQGDDIVPTLIEGPVGPQVRCQQLDQQCSYLELQALLDSGEEIPEYLQMDRETLAELIDQLKRVEAAVLQYPTLDDACAAGLVVSSAQSANMGIHVIDPGAGVSFNPDRPQMILFAKQDGERIPRLDIGTCEGDRFTGEAGFRPVGAVFNIALSGDHPDAFAGELDNWHVHLNTCAGGSIENASDVNPEVEITATSATAEECRAGGGFFLPVISSWMMHAYVVPEFDGQGGVFSMFNPNIWPLASSPEELRQIRTVGDDEAIAAPIVNFDFGEITAGVGDTIRFGNADSVPHTVTAGTPLDPRPGEFDSGLLGIGGTFDLSFDEPGEYQLFCSIHPEMQATVVVT
jgi:plastocyanin